MRRLLITTALGLALVGSAALAQDRSRFVDPAPVNFDQPFQFDGVKARFPPGDSGPASRNEDGTARGIPIEVWLANGRKMEGLSTREPRPTVNIEDGKALRELFKDLLPQEAPTNEAPASDH